jgi:2-polyprenyl-3-methyl-5-hydroxy-6-metoxy-1,4-benzoquinol methylase
MSKTETLSTVASDKITNALSIVEKEVYGEKYALDIAYFSEHKLRYWRTLHRITELCPVGGRILDVGSHYLHLSAALRLLGYEAVGMDVAVFSDQEPLKLRATKFAIANHVTNRIDGGDFLLGADPFDLISFTEIMEHITFNPISFWRRIYALMKVGSVIYITTPNSLTPWKILHSLKNMAMLRGTGLSTKEIFHNVTYGHHWKEYSAKELCEYFATLSPDFSVEVKSFNLPVAGNSRRAPISLKALARETVHWASGFMPAFRDQLEAVVHLKGKSRWCMDPPDFI